MWRMALQTLLPNISKLEQCEQNKTKIKMSLFNLHFQIIKMLLKQMAQDTKFRIHICKFKCYLSHVIRMWQMGLFIRHQCDERINTIIYY
jgi:hypothetical protein